MNLDQPPAVPVTIKSDPITFQLGDHDITGELVAYRIEGDRTNCYLTLTVKADADIEGWPVDRATLLDERLKDMRPEDWDAVIMSSGLSTTPGMAIAAHIAGESVSE